MVKNIFKIVQLLQSIEMQKVLQFKIIKYERSTGF